MIKTIFLNLILILFTYVNQINGKNPWDDIFSDWIPGTYKFNQFFQDASSVPGIDDEFTLSLSKYDKGFNFEFRMYNTMKGKIEFSDVENFENDILDGKIHDCKLTIDDYEHRSFRLDEQNLEKMFSEYLTKVNKFYWEKFKLSLFVDNGDNFMEFYKDFPFTQLDDKQYAPKID